MTSSRLKILRFDAQLRWRFRHASATRTRTENVIVALSSPDGSITGYGEACPRDYVTGETVRSVTEFVQCFGPEVINEVLTLEQLRDWMTARVELIDANPAAFAALEVAWFDCTARQHGISVESLLGVPELQGTATYSAVLGDGPLPVFAMQALAYRIAGMNDIKIKLSGKADRDRRKLKVLRSLFGQNCFIRADANNLWGNPDDCIANLCGIADQLWALEEPLAPGDLEGYRRVAAGLESQIILDESLTRISHLDELKKDPDTWVADVRVSKAGGIIRSIDLSRKAQTIGIPVILGAHVGETSILTRASLTVGSALKTGPLAREGAFGTWLLKNDLVSHPLKFGYGGKFRYPNKHDEGKGLGLETDKTRCRFRPQSAD